MTGTETTAPALGEWLWEIEQCRGSLDCWTAYVDHKVSPAEHWQGHLRRLPIIKRTPRRIYIENHGRTILVDRQALEADGEVRVRRIYATLYATEPPMPDGWDGRPAQATVKTLKAAMAAAHPDRGGDPAVFREAHARYERARTRAAS